MIQLTRLDQSMVLLNLELVKYVESVPDTLITFINGDSIMVKEPVEGIIEKIVTFKARVLKASQGPGTECS